MTKHQCDNCGQMAYLRRGSATGMEGAFCALCFGFEPTEFDDDPVSTALDESVQRIIAEYRSRPPRTRPPLSSWQDRDAEEYFDNDGTTS